MHRQISRTTGKKTRMGKLIKDINFLQIGRCMSHYIVQIWTHSFSEVKVYQLCLSLSSIYLLFTFLSSILSIFLSTQLSIFAYPASLLYKNHSMNTLGSLANQRTSLSQHSDSTSDGHMSQEGPESLGRINLDTEQQKHPDLSETIIAKDYINMELP